MEANKKSRNKAIEVSGFDSSKKLQNILSMRPKENNADSVYQKVYFINVMYLSLTQDNFSTKNFVNLIKIDCIH